MIRTASRTGIRPSDPAPPSTGTGTGRQTIEPDPAQRCHTGTSIPAVYLRSGLAPRPVGDARMPASGRVQPRTPIRPRTSAVTSTAAPWPAATVAWPGMAGSAGPR